MNSHFAKQIHILEAWMTHWILFSIIGILIGRIFFERAHSLRIISRNTLAIFDVVSPPMTVFLNFYFKNIIFLNVLMSIFIQFLPFIVMNINRHIRRKSFLRLRLPFIDDLILKMRSGQSMREAVNELCRSKTYIKSKDFSDLSVFLLQENHQNGLYLIPEAQVFLKQLLDWDQVSIKRLERITFFRNQLKQGEKFRQKSRQVTSQVRGQALICSVLYLFLCLWTFVNNKSENLYLVFFTSLSLFLFAQLGFYFVLRSFKWKV